MLNSLRSHLRPSSRCSHLIRTLATQPNTSSKWLNNTPSSILFVKKRYDEAVSSALENVTKHVRQRYPEVQLYHEESPELPAGLEPWLPSQSNSKPIDLIVTLGGDGTILHASSLFKTGPIPPVLSFSMGTLGFLLPFNIDTFPQALEEVFTGKASILERMRISCTFHRQDGSEIGGCGDIGWQVMNEVTLHRGRSPHLNVIDAYVDKQHLTEAVSDGLILSTPTGSTAYSLSSGGPIVHPSVNSLLLTPICPRSLSFRSLVLPGSSTITLRISQKSRAVAEVSMDGQEARVLQPGEFVVIKASPYPVPSIKRATDLFTSRRDMETERRISGERDGGDDWVRDINSLLQFNATFKNKHHATELL
ncbi:ATP-NAD kinase [Serendipita vermifera]|nr:ATP-NAD kinase [Serendipita vermifera]